MKLSMLDIKFVNIDLCCIALLEVTYKIKKKWF